MVKTVITDLQQIVAREIDFSKDGAAVISITSWVSDGGKVPASNVVPRKIELGGTVRAFSGTAMERLRGRVREVVAGVGRN